MTFQPSRRSVLTALGIAPLATGGDLPSAAAETSSVPADLRPGGTLDSYIAQLAAEDKFSGTVLLTYKNKPVLARSHQMADKARQVPNGPDTMFNVGSIGKTFTGVAIAQLAQQGKVSYSARVGTYLDGFAPEIADTVTVHHLITHTSGLGDYHSPEYFEQARLWNSVDEAWNGTMGFVQRLGLKFTPGSGGQYSNAAYFMLGAIVARVSGQSYYDYVREHVFGAAGMTSANFFTRPEWHENRRIAHPYAKSDAGEWADVIDEHGFISMPAGGVQVSAPDLVRFADAFQRDKLLSPAFTQLVASPKLPLSRDNSFFEGYSVGAHLAGGQWTYGHNGGSPNGVSCNLEWFPASGWVAVVLSNYPLQSAIPIASMARDLITRPR